MKSSRPYLLRALYDWIVDSDCTPYVVVVADVPGVRVPEGYAKDGRITLNLSPRSVRELVIDDVGLRFDARFGGRSFHVQAPCGAVVAIFAQENGRGMTFEPETGEESAATDGPKPPPTRPGLKIVR